MISIQIAIPDPVTDPLYFTTLFFHPRGDYPATVVDEVIVGVGTGGFAAGPQHRNA
jgi:hypothetical protein